MTSLVYDGANRHVQTVAPNGAGGQVTITYTRDATDRITTRTVTGAAGVAENGTTAYGYTAAGDAPDLDLTAAGGIAARTLGLALGVTLSKSYADPAGASRWFYPNIHADIIATTTSTGTMVGPLVCYDPYGTPINPTGALDADAGPDTNPTAFDAGYLGQHQRLTEHTAALSYTQMGARLYDPALGRFLEVDPIEGGSSNDYDYVSADPIGHVDLDGTKPVTLKKGQKLSCGKGRAAKQVYIAGSFYWDCYSTAKKLPGGVLGAFSAAFKAFTWGCSFIPTYIGTACSIANTVAVCATESRRSCGVAVGIAAVSAATANIANAGIARFGIKVGAPRLGYIAKHAIPGGVGKVRTGAVGSWIGAAFANLIFTTN